MNNIEYIKNQIKISKYFLILHERFTEEFKLKILKVFTTNGIPLDSIKLELSNSTILIHMQGTNEDNFEYYIGLTIDNDSKVLRTNFAIDLDVLHTITKMFIDLLLINV